MRGDLEYIFFDFDSDQILTNKSNIHRLMNAIVQDDEFRFIRPYTYEYPRQSFIENSPAALNRAWDEALDRGEYGPFIGCENEKGFGISFGFMSDELRQLLVVVNNGSISDQRPAAYDNVEVLVELLKIIYGVLAPAYGYGLTRPDVRPILPPYNAGEALSVIYDFNFFGPDLVQLLGRDNVRSVPTWQTVEFDDGGIFLALSPNPIADAERYASNYEQAAEMFRIETIYQRG